MDSQGDCGNDRQAFSRFSCLVSRLYSFEINYKSKIMPSERFRSKLVPYIMAIEDIKQTETVTVKIPKRI